MKKKQLEYLVQNNDVLEEISNQLGSLHGCAAVGAKTSFFKGRGLETGYTGH